MYNSYFFEIEKKSTSKKVNCFSSILNEFSNSHNVQNYSFWAGSTKGMRWWSSIQIFIDDQNPEEKIHPPFHNDRYQDQAWDPTFVLHMVGITVGIKWCKTFLLLYYKNLRDLQCNNQLMKNRLFKIDKFPLSMSTL